MRNRTSIRIGLVLAYTAALAGAADVVDWQDAARCVDRVCAVRGTVVAEEDDGGVLRLYFDAERRDVSVLLVRSLFRSWPSYAGREIVATGKVRRFRDQVEVVVQRPSDVTAQGDESPTVIAVESPAPAPTPMATPVPTRDATEADRLRRQIDDLEERLRELEDDGD